MSLQLNPHYGPSLVGKKRKTEVNMEVVLIGPESSQNVNFGSRNYEEATRG